MSSKNVGKPLTADLVFTKTKSDNLQNIKNLNLWGNDLQDLSLIEKMPNLQVISLSVNRISSLRYFACCQKLQELYLRKNSISDLRQIRHLTNLPSLKVLWLHDNPCAQIQNYRQIVVKHLPNLQKLDNNSITPQQRASSQNVIFNIQVPDNQSILQKGASSNIDDKKPRPSSNYFQQQASQKQSQQNFYSGQKQKTEKEKFQGLGKRTGMQNQNKKIYQGAKQQDINRNQNILMAILSLMRQLDPGSLEIVRRQAQKMLR